MSLTNLIHKLYPALIRRYTSITSTASPSTLTGENQPKLIDELSALVAGSEAYAAEALAECARKEAERAELEREYGVSNANDSIPYFVTSIKNCAKNGIRTFDINLQSHSVEYNLDIEQVAYAQTLTDYFRTEGLTVEWKRERHEPCRGSYMAFDEQRYSASLTLTW